MNDHRLEAVRFERDLGVIVDDELKFHMHTATATKKANQILGIIKKSYQTRGAVTKINTIQSYGKTSFGISQFHLGTIL